MLNVPLDVAIGRDRCPLYWKHGWNSCPTREGLLTTHYSFNILSTSKGIGLKHFLKQYKEARPFTAVYRDLATHIVQLLTVEVRVIRLLRGIQEKVRGQRLIGSQQELVEDVEIALIQLALADTVPLQQVRLNREREVSHDVGRPPKPHHMTWDMPLLQVT